MVYGGDLSDHKGHISWLRRFSQSEAWNVKKALEDLDPLK